MNRLDIKQWAEDARLRAKPDQHQRALIAADDAIDSLESALEILTERNTRLENEGGGLERSLRRLLWAAAKGNGGQIEILDKHILECTPDCELQRFNDGVNQRVIFTAKQPNVETKGLAQSDSPA